MASEVQSTIRCGRVTTLTKRISLVPGIPFAIIIVLIIMAIFAPIIAPQSPTDGELYDKLTPPSFMTGGDAKYLLGTDFLGRDILSRLIFGARVSLSVALLAIFVAGSVGTIMGLIAGYKGGVIDIVLMRVTDIGLSIPMILVAIVLAAIFGTSYMNIILVIGLLLWPTYARQIRGETLSIKEQEYITLARVAGCSSFRIMWRHILPNVTPTIIVISTLQVGWVILMEAALSFLGVGIPPPTPAWGIMIADARGLIGSAWWIALFPGLAIMFTVTAFNLLGDWIRDKLDPKLRTI